MNHSAAEAFPRGWFRIAAAGMPAQRRAVPLRCLGRELVLMRTGSDALALFDAYCPHQGAHLGHGGRVLGETLICPFHGWSYALDGRCLKIPHAEVIPAGAALQSYGLIERHGDLLADFGSAGEPAPDLIPEARDGQWSVVLEREWEIGAHIHDAIENLVDSAHFASLHHMPGLPQTGFEPQGQRARIVSELRMGSLEGPVPTRLVADGAGLGLWALRFTGIAEVTVLTAVTPLEPGRLAFYLKFWARQELGRAQKFAESVCLQVEQDKRIWEHKRFRPAPLLSAADGPIAAYRQWAQQFFENP